MKTNKDEQKEEEINYYQQYKDDVTLKQDTLPCKFSQLVRFSDIFDKILMTLGCFFALGNGISLIFYAQPLKDLIMAFDPHTTVDQVLQNVSIAVKAFFLNSVYVFLNASLMTIAWTISSQRQLIRVRNYYYQSLLKQQFAWYDRNKPEQVCSQMYIQTQRAQNSIVESITGILTCFSMGLGGLIFALAQGWKMAIVMALFMPVMIISSYIRAQLSMKWQKQLIGNNVNINGNIFEVFDNIKTVKYLEGEQYEVNRFKQQVDEYSIKTKTYKKKTAVTSAIGFFCIIFNYALGFWYGTKLVADKTYNANTGANYDVGDVVSIFFCVYVSNLNITGISGHFSNFYNSRIALSKIIGIIDRKPIQSKGTLPCIAQIEQISFKNITFQFSQPLFNNLSLTIKKGVVAIVGSSGNGKSTLLNLLMKFYQPFKGEIFLKSAEHTQNLKDIQAKSLRKRIGYVGQEPVLLGNTLREVLCESYVSDQTIWHTLNMCCAGEFAHQIGLQSQFKSLSGGQKQRIAIARAVLRQPQILILDEGTSALDGINERKILKNLKQKSKIQFIIMIAHRTETLSEASTIIKVNNGKAEIIEERQGAILIKKIEEQQRPIDEEIEKQKTVEKVEETKEQKRPPFQFKYLMKLIRMNKSNYHFYIFGIIAGMFLGVIFPSFSYIITQLCSIATDIKYAVTDEQIQSLRSKGSYISMILMLISIFSIFLTIIKQNSFLVLGENLGLKLKKYSFEVLIKLEMAEIDILGKNNLAHLVTAYSDGAKNLATSIVESFSQHLFTLIVGLGIAFIYCWQISLVSILLIPLSLIGGKFQHSFLSGLSENSDKIHRKTHEIVLQTIIHNRTVKSLNLQEYFYEKYKLQQQKGFDRSLKAIILSGITLGLSQCLISIMLSLIYYIGAIFVEEFNIKIVDLFTAIYAIMFSGVQVGCNIGFIGQISGACFNTTKYFETVGPSKIDEFELQSVSPPSHQLRLIQQLQADSQIPESKVDVSMSGAVQFKNVAFRYSSREDYLFRGLSFKIHPKERVAFVGQSGTGKTTIADLLLKIYRPEEGEILLDGINTAFYSKSSISNQFAIVSQEPALFNRSLFENIRYNSNATIQEVMEAAKMANAYDFIEDGAFGSDNKQSNYEMALSNWYRGVGSKGNLLSGGQKQRVAVARAIVRKPKILIMDEATSALDKQTEEELLKNLNKKMNITQIVIAHRISTIKSCERILVFKEGALIESGSYQQLIDQGGEFAQLVNAIENK